MPCRARPPTREELWTETAKALRNGGHYAIVIVGDDNDPPGHISREAEPILAISKDAPLEFVCDLYLRVCIERRGGDVESGKALASHLRARRRRRRLLLRRRRSRPSLRRHLLIHT